MNQDWLIHRKAEKHTEKMVQRAPHQTLPGRIGTGILDFFVKIPNLSSVTGVWSGAYIEKGIEIGLWVVFLANPNQIKYIRKKLKTHTNN